MVSHGAAWTTRIGPRGFVRAVAVLVGLANLVGVIAWFVGGLRVLGGEAASSLVEALPSVIAAVVAGLLTSRIALQALGSAGRGFRRRYEVAVMSVCVGGAIEGGMLGWVFAVDGTLFPEAPPEFYAREPLLLLAHLTLSLPAAFVGAGMGLAVGLAEGLVLALPLAAALGALRYD